MIGAWTYVCMHVYVCKEYSTHGGLPLLAPPFGRSRMIKQQGQRSEAPGPQVLNRIENPAERIKARIFCRLLSLFLLRACVPVGCVYVCEWVSE